MIPNRGVHIQSDKPPIKNVELQLFHQLPFGSDGIDDLKNSGPKKILGGDGGAPDLGIEGLKVRGKSCQNLVDHGFHWAKGMVFRNPIFGSDVTEQVCLGEFRATHRSTSNWNAQLHHKSSEIGTGTDSFFLLFQQPARRCEDLILNIDDGMSFKTSAGQAFFLGTIGIRIKGTLRIKKDSTWTFEGKYFASEDTYDFNPGDRGFVGETLAGIGRTFHGEPYQIRINGNKDVSASGNLPAERKPRPVSIITEYWRGIGY